MNLTTLTQMFIKARRADGRAARTLQDYKRVLNPFATWCEQQNINLDSLGRASIRDYVCLLRSNDWSSGTLSIYIRVLRTFLRWLHTEELKEQNLAKVVKPEKPTIREEDLPTPEELRKMLEACQGDKLATRDRAMILSMLDTGLRLGEMILLQKEQLHPDSDGETMWMKVYTPKTNGHHFVFLGVEAAKALRTYLQERKDDWPELWVGIRGPLTTLGIYRALRRRAEKVELNPARVHPHAFRKLFATFWMDNGGDVISLKRLGGWKTTAVVEQYVLLTGRQQLGKLHRQHSPSDRLLGA